jgi:Xaa-Pro aminopeptidase
MSRWLRTLPVLTLLPLAALAAQQPFVSELPGMGRPIDVAATAARRQRLMQRLGDAVVLIPAAHEKSVEGIDYPQDNDFRQHNTFFYFSMLEAQDAWIVMNASAGSGDAILFLPPRNAAQERWTGVRLGPDTLATRLTGFTTVLPTTRLDSVLAALAARNVPLYVPMDVTTREEPVVQRLRSDTGAGRVARNLRPIVDSLRVIKDAVEIAALRTAARISAEAHADLMRAARPGMFEYEMEAVIEAGFRRRGADRLGYPSIVGSGINGTTLHYDVNRRQSRDGDLVVVDAAAEYAQYTADVTRTFPVNGRFTPRQRAIYDLVLGTQQAAMDSVHPGQSVPRLNQIAREYMRAHSGDLCPPGPGEKPDQTSCDRYFIHGLSHGIGMDVHDVGRLNVLAPGAVFTIEPGIYIPSEALGVRIEDDILVTETGGENLSAAAPRAAADIERLMREGRSRAAATRSGR